jgi:hypothetical protein
MRFQPDRAGSSVPSADTRHPLLPKLVRQDCRLSEQFDFHRIASEEGSEHRNARSGENPHWLKIQSPCSRPRDVSRRGAQAGIPQSCSGRRDLDIAASEMVMNMRGRFFGSISAWLRRQDAKGGHGKPRLTRGFPVWAFLAVSPRAGRNSRKFSSARSRTRRICRLRSA